MQFQETSLATVNEFIDLVDDSIRRVVKALEEILLEDGIKTTLELKLVIEKTVKKAYREALIRKECSLQFLAEVIARPIIAKFYPRKKWRIMLRRIICRASSNNGDCEEKKSKMRIWW